MIDPDVYDRLSRAIFQPNADIYTVGFSTHRMKPLLSSAVFSRPSELRQMDGGGSIGEEFTDIEAWPLVGAVDKTEQTRNFYRKRYCICNRCGDPEMKLRWLWGGLRQRQVKNPVIRHIYIEREGVHMMWRYYYKPTRYIAGLQRLQQFSVDGDFERAFTFDIIAVSKIPLETEDLQDAVTFAHNRFFLHNYVRPVLMSAHSEPTPMVRREWVDVPRVVVNAIPITRWRDPVL